MESLPVGVCVADPLYIFEVPVATAAGKDEKDFSKVVVRTHSTTSGGPIHELVKVEYFSDGKLGALKGGLLDLHVHRTILTQNDIKNMAGETVDQALEKRRTGSQTKYTIHKLDLQTVDFFPGRISNYGNLFFDRVLECAWVS